MSVFLGVGSAMGKPRSNLVSFQCSVCHRVWDGAEWMVERRRVEGEVYAQGLCETCKGAGATGTANLGNLGEAPLAGA